MILPIALGILTFLLQHSVDGVTFKTKEKKISNAEHSGKLEDRIFLLCVPNDEK